MALRELRLGQFTVNFAVGRQVMLVFFVRALLDEDAFSDLGERRGRARRMGGRDQAPVGGGGRQAPRGDSTEPSPVTSAPGVQASETRTPGADATGLACFSLDVLRWWPLARADADIDAEG